MYEVMRFNQCLIQHKAYNSLISDMIVCFILLYNLSIFEQDQMLTYIEHIKTLLILM